MEKGTAGVNNKIVALQRLAVSQTDHEHLVYLATEGLTSESFKSFSLLANHMHNNKKYQLIHQESIKHVLFVQ